MKIRIPFKLFGGQVGELELDFPLNTSNFWTGKADVMFKQASKDAERFARYMGIFKDVFERVILGYERVPGIEHVFQTLIDCDTDEIIRKRLLELSNAREEEKASSE